MHIYAETIEYTVFLRHEIEKTRWQQEEMHTKAIKVIQNMKIMLSNRKQVVGFNEIWKTTCHVITVFSLIRAANRQPNNLINSEKFTKIKEYRQHLSERRHCSSLIRPQLFFYFTLADGQRFMIEFKMH